MTTISPTAEAAREEARAQDGRFSAQIHSEPEAEIGTGPNQTTRLGRAAGAAASDIFVETFGTDTAFENALDDRSLSVHDVQCAVIAAADRGRAERGLSGREPVRIDFVNTVLGDGFYSDEDLDGPFMRTTLEYAYLRAVSRYEGDTRTGGRLRGLDADLARRSGEEEVEPDQAALIAEDLLQHGESSERISSHTALAELAADPRAYAGVGYGDEGPSMNLFRDLRAYQGVNPVQSGRRDFLFTYAVHGAGSAAPYSRFAD